MRLRDGLMLRDDPQDLSVSVLSFFFSVFVSSFHLREKLDHFWMDCRKGVSLLLGASINYTLHLGAAVVHEQDH